MDIEWKAKRPKSAAAARTAVPAALVSFAALVDSSSPVLALDKVTFGLNWLADPEAGGYYQAAVDGAGKASSFGGSRPNSSARLVVSRVSRSSC